MLRALAIALLAAAAPAPARAAAAPAAAPADAAGAAVWQHRGAPAAITGFWQGTEADGEPSIGVASTQGFAFILLADGAPQAIVGLARGHNCSGGGAEAPHYYTSEYGVRQLAVDGSASAPVAQCELDYVPDGGASWNWVPPATGAPPGACPAPGGGAAIPQARVPRGAPPDLSGAPCGAGASAAARAEPGDAADAPADPAAAFPALPAAGGPASVSGVYLGPAAAGAPAEWVGIMAPSGFIFATWDAAAGSFYLDAGEYTSHACVPGAPYDYVATLVQRTIFLNGTVAAGYACEAGRYDAQLRVMRVVSVAAGAGAACPAADFGEGDFSQRRVVEFNHLLPAECGAGAAARATSAPAPAAAAPRALLGAAAAAVAALAWA